MKFKNVDKNFVGPMPPLGFPVPYEMAKDVIDIEIRELVDFLNQKEISTHASCSGHGNLHFFYISFFGIKNAKKLSEILNNTKVANWNVSVSCGKNEDIFILRYKPQIYPLDIKKIIFLLNFNFSKKFATTEINNLLKFFKENENRL